ncbi:ATP-binding protein [Streptomyces sp. NBC_00536]|uniref:ATP-binding protein n=1 Tax=Streptomyces sp. NBC_00536 TaxID=2975769 RepID=UPI002E81C76E|nr:ATP-binding protein [Streptomyces sp. NBC_00536]WUC83468.1 ATP-binding protein [Streptomyces sp. NBC_00536]
MPIAAPPLDTALRLVGVPHPAPVLDRAEAVFERTGMPDTDNRRIGEVRRLVSARLGLWGLHEFTDAATLLSSELVTNALTHADGEMIRVRLYWTELYLCLEVHDGGDGDLLLRPAALLDESGRGLGIVDSIATGWGRTQDHAGVWCTLSLCDEEAM